MEKVDLYRNARTRVTNLLMLGPSGVQCPSDAGPFADVMLKKRDKREGSTREVSGLVGSTVVTHVPSFFYLRSTVSLPHRISLIFLSCSGDMETVSHTNRRARILKSFYSSPALHHLYLRISSASHHAMSNPCTYKIMPADPPAHFLTRQHGSWRWSLRNLVIFTLIFLQ